MAAKKVNKGNPADDPAADDRSADAIDDGRLGDAVATHVDPNSVTDHGEPETDVRTGQVVGGPTTASTASGRRAKGRSGPETPTAAMVALRRTRQRHRLGNIEWFEAAYRVYLLALFGGGTVLWLSGLIGDKPVDPATADAFARHAPAVLGVAAVLALLAGLRSGAQGGPLALEAPDVMYVMLAPVDRRRALVRPAIQRLRSAAYAGGVLGAIAGQLAGRRLPGSTIAWAASGAIFGIAIGMIWIGAAMVAHATHAPLWSMTLVGLALLVWQVFAAVGTHAPAPGNLVGSLALWGWRQRGIDALALVVIVAVVIVGLALLRRTSLDALARRSGLVAQLRFAVTMQDLRTVILLRRQLNQEQTRNRPWVRLPTRNRKHAVWRRGWHSLLRLPATRVVRMALVAAAAGASQALVLRGTSPALLLTAGLLFLLGLESMEPLSQEVDQPDRAESLPIERGSLMVRHLAAPAAALVPFALIAAAAATVVTVVNSHGRYTWSSAATVAAILCIPTVLGGAAGAVVSIVRDAPDPFANASQQAFMPPEMAGVTTLLRVVIPLVVSALATVNVLLVRQAELRGDSTVGAAIRGAIGTILLVAATAWWVRKRDDMRKAIKSFMSQGRDYTTEQRSAR
ncbi:MAG: hypothetical protein JWM12_3519 [Ilumatobacteraceae bacterium]|nr:hypothetical protein [Ilumatobacteraceae bacterium]